MLYNNIGAIPAQFSQFKNIPSETENLETFILSCTESVASRQRMS